MSHMPFHSHRSDKAYPLSWTTSWNTHAASESGMWGGHGVNGVQIQGDSVHVDIVSMASVPWLLPVLIAFTGPNLFMCRECLRNQTGVTTGCHCLSRVASTKQLDLIWMCMGMSFLFSDAWIVPSFLEGDAIRKRNTEKSYKAICQILSPPPPFPSTRPPRGPSSVNFPWSEHNAPTWFAFPFLFLRLSAVLAFHVFWQGLLSAQYAHSANGTTEWIHVPP